MPHTLSLPLHPSVALVLSAVLGILMACMVMAVGVLWAKVRSLPLEQTTRLVDDLARRQDTIEVLLNRREADQGEGKGGAQVGVANAPAGPGAGASPPHRADPAATTAFGGPTLIAIPSLSSSVMGASAAAAEELGRRFGAIWALAEAGESAESIARTTGQPIGQVELILGLRRQLTQTSQPGGRA